MRFTIKNIHVNYSKKRLVGLMHMSTENSPGNGYCKALFQSSYLLHHDGLHFVANQQHPKRLHWLSKHIQFYLILFVLSGVRKTWNHSCYTRGWCDFTCIYHNQQFHQIVVYFARSRLHDVHIFAANRLANFNAANKKQINHIRDVTQREREREKKHLDGNIFQINRVIVFNSDEERWNQTENSCQDNYLRCWFPSPLRGTQWTCIF